MTGFNELLEKILKKTKTVEDIRCIYSEVSEQGHRWIHFDDVRDLLQEWWSGRPQAHSFEDGEEIQVNITDENSSISLIFGSEASYREFCGEVAKLQKISEAV